jgi:hypothetical protein
LARIDLREYILLEGAAGFCGFLDFRSLEKTRNM